MAQGSTSRRRTAPRPDGEIPEGNQAPTSAVPPGLQNLFPLLVPDWKLALDYGRDPPKLDQDLQNRSGQTIELDL